MVRAKSITVQGPEKQHEYVQLSIVQCTPYRYPKGLHYWLSLPELEVQEQANEMAYLRRLQKGNAGL